MNEIGRDILTDIDVLSLSIDNRLHLSSASLECKSGKGQSGEAYTIVWLAGFRQLLRLDQVTIVRQAVTSRGRALARRLGIVAIDDQALKRLESAYEAVPERFAHVDGPECLLAEERTDKQLKGLPTISLDLVRFLRGHGTLADSPALISAVVALGSSFDRQGAVPEPTAQVLSGHALNALVLAAVLDAGRVDQIGHADLRRRLERALTLGDADDDYILQVLERADAVVRWSQDKLHRAYVENGADRLNIDVPSLRDTIASPPDFIDDYIDFVLRLRANPLVGRELLQTTELVCFDALLGGTAWRAESFEHLFTPAHRGLLMVALRCLRRIGGGYVADPLQDISNLPFRTGVSAPFDPVKHGVSEFSGVSKGEAEQQELPIDP
ncbi:hypothetical protein [Nocardia asteroides]|uniref:hypothetical protein n=1 Tax=Nocardia asteroides TaxID=1824 RepID=UPI001E58D3AD|nr:hypothetical protein [Nocardia asteroides]UGT63990.1 hypothetical protein LTT61_12070 [Nocardia asteroides]